MGDSLYITLADIPTEASILIDIEIPIDLCDHKIRHPINSLFRGVAYVLQGQECGVDSDGAGPIHNFGLCQCYIFTEGHWKKL